eukprot:gene7302-11621_t
MFKKSALLSPYSSSYSAKSVLPCDDEEDVSSKLSDISFENSPPSPREKLQQITEEDSVPKITVVPKLKRKKKNFVKKNETPEIKPKEEISPDDVLQNINLQIHSTEEKTVHESLSFMENIQSYISKGTQEQKDEKKIQVLNQISEYLNSNQDILTEEEREEFENGTPIDLMDTASLDSAIESILDKFSSKDLSSFGMSDVLTEDVNLNPMHNQQVMERYDSNISLDYQAPNFNLEELYSFESDNQRTSFDVKEYFNE